MQHPFINDLVRFFGVTVPVIVLWVVFVSFALEWLLAWLMGGLLSLSSPRGDLTEHEFWEMTSLTGFLHGYFILYWIHTERERAGQSEEQDGLLFAETRLSGVPAESAAFKAAGFGWGSLRFVFLFLPLLLLYMLFSGTVIEYVFALITGQPAWSDHGWEVTYASGLAGSVFIFWWTGVERGITERRKAEWAARQSEQQSARFSAD